MLSTQIGRQTDASEQFGQLENGEGHVALSISVEVIKIASQGGTLCFSRKTNKQSRIV